MSGYTVVDLAGPSYRDHPVVPILIGINQACTIALLITLCASIPLPFLRPKNPKIKYLIGISLCLTGALIATVGQSIWRHWVYIYVGI